MSNEAPTDALRLVPTVPTPEMLAAFWRQKNTGSQEPGQTGENRSDYDAYRALLAAAPASPTIPWQERRIEDDGVGGYRYAPASPLPEGGAQCSGISGELDPRLVEWGYTSLDEAITHLGKLLDDQAAFDGLAATTGAK